MQTIAALKVENENTDFPSKKQFQRQTFPNANALG